MYIISLKHTNKTDSFLTLWRPDNKGYCTSLQSAGIYFEPEKGYHDSDDNMPIDIHHAAILSSSVKFDDELRDCIPNVKYILDELGIRFKGKNLVKK